jgi:pimeloyl-ACP methyl ester carboxylesterase
MPTTTGSGLEIRYEVVGEGTPLVLLHGLMGSSDVWRLAGWVPLLNQFKLVLIDARGHGRSAAPIDPAGYGPDRDASDVVAVLDDAGVDRAAVCGWSMGATIALQTAALHPDRVAAVIAVGLPPGEIWFEDTPRLDPAALLADAEWFEREGTGQVVKALMAEGRSEWVPMIEPTAGPALGARLRGVIAASPVPARLCELRQPLVLVWGEAEQPRVPLPLPGHAQVTVIPGEDHIGALCRTDVIVPLIHDALA